MLEATGEFDCGRARGLCVVYRVERHEAEDELVYVPSGTLTLADDNGEHPLQAGYVAGFPAGVPNAHHLVNKSAGPATFFAIGSQRPREDTVHHPDDDIGPVRR